MKIEEKLDTEIKKLVPVVMTYHFTKEVAPFSAITVVDDWNKSTWNEMRECLDSIFKYKSMWNDYEPATQFMGAMRKMNIYGVAICDKSDQFNRRTGRIIAKGRLLKHLILENK